MAELFDGDKIWVDESLYATGKEAGAFFGYVCGGYEGPEHVLVAQVAEHNGEEFFTGTVLALRVHPEHRKAV